jgi:hypothetical protein
MLQFVKYQFYSDSEILAIVLSFVMLNVSMLSDILPCADMPWVYRHYVIEKSAVMLTVGILRVIK